MVELGQLERHADDFARRNVKVVAISNDDRATASATQADFPHLVVVADRDQAMARALGILHEGAGPKGTDTNAPTTFLLDSTGTVRWLFRPDRFIVRLPAAEVLAAIDKTDGK